jgi:HK97 family phage portal protein
MSWIQNLKNKFWKEEKSKTFRLRSSTGYGGTVWSEHNYENFAKESYLKNVIAFRVIDIIAKNVSTPPWEHFRKLKDGTREQINDSWVNDLIKRPNPGEAWPYLMLKSAAYLVMSGNNFLERIKPETGPNKENIKELYSHRPDRFTFGLNKENGILEKYIYEINGQEIEFDIDPITQQSDILHLKNFHPTDDWWGAAATESAAREIDTFNAATEWNKNLLDNQGRPGMVFTLVGQAGDEFRG